MKVWIRVDIGGEAGMGHSLRCRALARLFSCCGVEVVFLTETPLLMPFVAPFECMLLDNKNRDFGKEDILIIDHKKVEAHHFNTVRNIKIVALDKPHASSSQYHLCIAPCAHWDAATVTRLHHDFGERFLYGWDYVILDPAITAQRPIPYTDREQGPIVFCAGGSDPDGALATMAEWCGALVKRHDWIFLLAERSYPYGIGGQYPWAACRRFSQEGWRYIRGAALVVSMFGQTVYDCLWWGTPVLTCARTIEDARALTRLSAVGVDPIPSDYLPLWSVMTQARFCATVEAYMDEDVRHGMAAASAGLLDGQGVQRVADAIMRCAA